MTKIGVDKMKAAIIFCYMQVDGHTDDSSTSEEEQSTRDVETWCFCGNCKNMSSRVEEICCTQHAANNRLKERRTENNKLDDFQCITDHPGFYYNCLVSEVLDESWKGYKQMYGKAAVEGSLSKRRRHTAYRNLCRFVFGFTRKRERMVLPSCAVSNIRDTFEDTEPYTGFKKRKMDDK